MAHECGLGFGPGSPSSAAMAAANLRQRILLQYYVCANGLYQGVFRSGRPDGLPGAADVVGRQIVLITLSPGLRVATNTCSIYATYFQYSRWSRPRQPASLRYPEFPRRQFRPQSCQRRRLGCRTDLQPKAPETGPRIGMSVGFRSAAGVPRLPFRRRVRYGIFETG